MSRRRVAVSNVKSISTPEEDTKSYSIVDAKDEIHTLREEIRSLKKAQGILLVCGVSPTLDGHQLSRCRCGKFATRLFSITHPIAGLHHQRVCDGCKVEHPVAQNSLSKIEPVPYATARVIGLARDLNTQIEETFK